MSSHKQRGRGYKGRVRAEPYRPWNAAALGKSTSGSIYNPVLEKFTSLTIKDQSMNNDGKYDGSKLRPWNAAFLNKCKNKNKFDIVENGSSVSNKRNTAVDSQQSVLFPDNSKQNNSWNQEGFQSRNNLQSSVFEDLNQINWEDYSKQLMQEEARRVIEEIRRQNQNHAIDKTLLEQFDALSL